jgi:hypothetical protein
MYSKFPVIQYPSIQNSHPTGKHSKENLQLLYSSSEAKLHSAYDHPSCSILPVAHSSIPIILLHIGAFAVGAVLPRKISMQELKKKKLFVLPPPQH